MLSDRLLCVPRMRSDICREGRGQTNRAGGLHLCRSFRAFSRWGLRSRGVAPGCYVAAPLGHGFAVGEARSQLHRFQDRRATDPDEPHLTWSYDKAMSNCCPTPFARQPGRIARAAGGTLYSSAIGVLSILDRFFERLRILSILRDHRPREDRRCRIVTVRDTGHRREFEEIPCVMCGKSGIVNRYASDLAAMMTRRHWIAHCADRNSQRGPGHLPVTSLSNAMIIDWLRAVEQFVNEFLAKRCPTEPSGG